jgi:vacuolar-type H+-ATPase subunit F/Vma7
MGQVTVITTPDLAPGYQLAGVETLAVVTVEDAEVTLRQLLDNREAGLIIVRRALLEAMDPRLQQRAQASIEPVVMPIAGRAAHLTGQEYLAHLSEMIRRTVGFHLNLGGEAGED